jgi:hypothetical protein
MTQHEHAQWLYEQVADKFTNRWQDLTPEQRIQWVRLGAFVQADRKNLAGRLRRGLDAIFASLARPLDGGTGYGFREIKDVIRELDPKGPIT